MMHWYGLYLSGYRLQDNSCNKFKILVVSHNKILILTHRMVQCVVSFVVWYSLAALCQVGNLGSQAPFIWYLYLHQWGYERAIRDHREALMGPENGRYHFCTHSIGQP